MEKQIKKTAESAARLIVQELPELDFDYKYLKSIIADAIENSKK